jgi:hypothetical protein
MLKGTIRHIVAREAAVKTSLRSHVGVQRLCFTRRTVGRTNGLYLVCCCLECALTHRDFHADCACVPPHAASGALYHLDVGGNAIDGKYYHSLQMMF